VVATPLVTGTPFGWGREFRRPGWYHVCIPTLIYTDLDPWYLEEVIFLTYREDMEFREVHVWTVTIAFGLVRSMEMLR
jgi:hypothetical protein